ncbi:MAG: aldehyde ferredoxin oxidoreductase family protein [Spirochaetia bacterium]
MADLCGYFGKLLRVSLDKGSAREENIDPQVLRKYLGGTGYAARVLFDELAKGTNPLGAENKIIFVTSPLTSKRVPGGGSIILCFKSPETNAWGESRCGGDFGPELKSSGYDALIVEGKSDFPVYLTIRDREAILKPGYALVGKTVSEKTELIRKDLNDPSVSIMCIGPAGENKVRIANVMSGGRAAGRGGAGAILGSKNLLAIGVRGSQKVPIARPEELQQTIKSCLKILRNSETATSFRKHGTIGDMPANDAAGDLPTKNWISNSWGKGEQLYDEFYKKHLVKNKSCYTGCPIACGRLAEVKEGEYKTPIHEGCEYESISAFTAFIMNERIDVAIYATYLCNEYGIDTISAGALIAFAMECNERGVLQREHVGDLNLSWGNSDAIVELVRMISLREGLGDILADGVRLASQKLGKGSEQFAIHVKGLEGPAHDPRSGKILAVTYGTASRGMCHIHPLEGMAYDSGKISWGLMKYGVPDPNGLDRWDEKGKGTIAKILQDGMVIPDVLNTCKFFMYHGIGLEHLAALMSASTGWDIDGKELLLIGERTINLQRLFNFREGLRQADDLVPERILKRPEFGLYAKEEQCVIRDMESMLMEYYEARGWDRSTGIPTKAKLRELDIDGPIDGAPFGQVL